jgi:hypothetical protein
VRKRAQQRAALGTLGIAWLIFLVTTLVGNTAAVRRAARARLGRLQ